MDYQIEIKRLQALQMAEEEQQRANQQTAWKTLQKIPDNWEWRASSAECESCRVEKRMKATILKKWKKQGPPAFSSDWMDGRWRGILYTRTDEGILTTEGGGYHILNTPKLCNDEEWAAICSGNIPEKFIR